LLSINSAIRLLLLEGPLTFVRGRQPMDALDA